MRKYIFYKDKKESFILYGGLYVVEHCIVCVQWVGAVLHPIYQRSTLLSLTLDSMLPYRINILQGSSFIVIIFICANNQRGSHDNSLHYFSIRFTKVGGTFLVHFTLRTIYSKICKYFRVNKQQMLYFTELPASPKILICTKEKSAGI